MPDERGYDIHLDTKCGYSTRIDIPAMAAACDQPWFNQTLTQVNDSVVRLGIVHGEFHWHEHELEDEFFFVLQGKLLIDLADGEVVELGPHQGYTVPRGVRHRTRAPTRTIMLMVEPSAIQPTGD